jgi:hypothetical protein
LAFRRFAAVAIPMKFSEYHILARDYQTR